MTEATTTEAPKQSADLHASIDQVQGQLVEFDKISAGLAAIEKAHPKDIACAVSTVAGMKQAIAGRAAWREPRIAVEKVRKAAKAPVLALGRDIDAFARSLELKLLEGETHYDDQIKAEEARREAERQEKLRKEAERVAGIRDRINENFTFAPSMMDGSTAAELEGEIKRMVAIEIDATYQELAGEAALAKDAALAILRRMQEKAAAREAEEIRLKAERAELERQRAEQARVEAEARKAREEEAARLRQEREALAAERAEQLRQENEARAAREKADREDRARRDEEDRLARQARAEEEKRIAAERAALEAQQRAAREAEERRQAEARRIEQERLDAEAAERRRIEDEQIAARRREEEAQHQAAMRVREAAPQMLEILTRWQAADKAPRDKVEQQAVRVARDELLAGLA
jgi:hypothetical protein